MMECRPKCMKSLSPKIEICEPKIQQEKPTFRSNSAQSTVPWHEYATSSFLPPIDGLVDVTVLQLSPDRDEAN